MVRILIVDDDAAIGESLAELLMIKVPDAQASSETDPKEALAQLREGRPDLIISDYRMPGMDGLTFLEHARRLHPDVPAVLMTALSEQEVAAEAIGRGTIRRFYPKPLDVMRMIDDLVALLDETSAAP